MAIGVTDQKERTPAILRSPWDMQASRMTNAELSGRQRGFGQQALEAAKWVALISMTVDHYGKIVDLSLYAETHAVGRLAYPLFAGIIGVRLAVSPRLAPGYLRNLIPWALLSQPVYVAIGKDWTQGNILMTLALGVLAYLGFDWWRAGRRGLATAVCVGLVVIAPYVDFGIAGVAMIPLVALSASDDPWRRLWLVGPFGVLANIFFHPPFLTRLDLYAVFASLPAVASPYLSRYLPRIPKHVFYAYYPAHLWALHLIDQWF